MLGLTAWILRNRLRDGGVAGEEIDAWRFKTRRQEPHRVETEIIHHDEQDIGLGLGGERGRREEESGERG